MTPEPTDPLAEAFAGALTAVGDRHWQRDPAPDLATRARRRRRSQVGALVVALALAVMLAGWLVSAYDGRGGSEPPPMVTVPPATTPTTPTTPTTASPCLSAPTPTEPCALAAGSTPGGSGR